jgi:alpha-L-fucosidase
VIITRERPSRTVVPGGTLTVTGGSFQANELVSIYLGHASGTPLAQVASGDGGEFSAPITIPAATAAGKHTLIAVDNAGDRAIKTITVS